jgi:HSP20 family protein
MAKETELKVRNEQAIQKAPAREFDVFRDMERMFDDFMSRGWLRPWRFDWPMLGEATRRVLETRAPSVDVIDGDREVTIKAELPGVDKKDLEVTATDDAVTIKGSTRREEKEEKGDYYRHEITRGSFSRTVSLPAVVDGSKAKATFKDGMLELVLPKVEERKRRTIAVE